MLKSNRRTRFRGLPRVDSVFTLINKGVPLRRTRETESVSS